MQYARLVHAIGSEKSRDLLILHPGRPGLEPDPALDFGAIGEAVQATYKASRAALRFDWDDVLPEYRGKAPRHGGGEQVCETTVAAWRRPLRVGPKASPPAASTASTTGSTHQ